MTIEQDRARARARARAKAAAADKGSGAAPSALQQLFDVKNAATGESYLYGNTPAPSQFEDVQRTVRDTLSRGYADKFKGPDEQAKTARARERMPDWAELPTDIGAAVYGSPARAAGGVFGGVEGMASEYGHQRNWVPSWDEWKDIGWAGAKGAALGAGAGQIGKWVGKLKGGKAAKEAQEFPTDEALEDAVNNPAGRKAAEQAENFDRLDRVNAAREAQATGTRDAFAKLRTFGPEYAAQQKLIKQPNIAQRALQAGGKAAEPLGSKLGLAAFLEGVVNKDLGWGTAAAASARALSEVGKRTGQMSPKMMEEYVSLVRDPAGKGMAADPATVDKWRALFSQIGSGAARSPASPDPQDMRQFLFGGPR